jgi:hypothetical protein
VEAGGPISAVRIGRPIGPRRIAVTYQSGLTLHGLPPENPQEEPVPRCPARYVDPY